jgi:Tfp pilus assembly protein PilV
MTRQHPRPGLTLLEVIVSMVIFLMSVIAISQLILMGSERADDVRLQTRTSLRCQSKLAEYTVGIETLSAVGGGYAPFQDDFDKDLQWKAEATQEYEGLWTVKISVKADLKTGRTVESTLTQMILDPTIRGTTFDVPAPLPTPSSSGG